MNKDTIENLIAHSNKIELLERYTKFLQKEGYLDTDAFCEEPTAIDLFIESERRQTNRGGVISKEDREDIGDRIRYLEARRDLMQCGINLCDAFLNKSAPSTPPANPINFLKFALFIFLTLMSFIIAMFPLWIIHIFPFLINEAYVGICGLWFLILGACNQKIEKFLSSFLD